MARLNKNFLGEEPEARVTLTAADGFRFGLGFMMAWLVVALMVTAVAWLGVVWLHLGR